MSRNLNLYLEDILGSIAKIQKYRDTIAHAYFSINARIVWNVIQSELNPLKNCVELIQIDENLES